jgi:hypothetical protein
VPKQNGVMEHKNYTLVEMARLFHKNCTLVEMARMFHKNCTLVEMARMMLDEHKTPRRFWAKAINTPCYISN